MRLTLTTVTLLLISLNAGNTIAVETDKQTADTLPVTNDKEANAPESEVDESMLRPLPPPLTIENFDSVLSDGAHFVEFFSPYCHHCKALAPKWHEFYDSFHAEGQELGVSIHQVDCVESGDLCQRESIKFYPALRLYGPNDDASGGKFITAYTKSEGRNAEGFSDFLREQMVELNDELTLSAEDMQQFHQTNHVDAIDSTDMLNIIGGKIDRPYLVSLWPSTDEELNPKTFQKDYKEVEVFSQCDGCFEFRTVWNKAVQSLSGLIKKEELSMGYLNCKSNEKICEALGFGNLIHDDVEEYVPQMYMFLPSDKGGNKIRLNGNMLTSKMIADWAKRLIRIYKFENVTVKDLGKKMKLAKTLPQKDGIADFDKQNAISFIYLYSEDTYFEEDDILLQHLIQPIMDLNTNVNLYKSSDSKFLDLVKNQEIELVKYLNEELPEGEQPYEYDEKMFTARTLSTLPTLICIKDNSLISTVFQSFGTRDIRDFKPVMDFIKVNADPQVQELNDATRNLIFPPSMDADIHSHTEKVAILLTDLNHHKEFFTQSYYMSQIAHRFNFIRTLKQWASLSEDRDIKHLKVDELKAENADQAEIIKALRKKIPKVFTINQQKLLTVYVDVSKLPYFRKIMKWDNVNPDDYKTGDVLLLSRFGNRFWEATVDAESKLKIDKVSDVINVLESASYQNFGGKKLRSSFTISNIFRYSVMIIILVLVVRLIMRSRWIQRLRFKGGDGKYRPLDPELGHVPAVGGVSGNGSLGGKFD